MLTKQIGAIAEQAAILAALKRGYGVSVPLGDYLPYDLIFDVSNQITQEWKQCI